MNTALCLALGLCVSCAAAFRTHTWVDHLPNLHACALAFAAMAIASGTRDHTAGAARLAGRLLRDGPGAMDASSTVSEDEVQAWQAAIDLVTPEHVLPPVRTQAWPGFATAGALAAADPVRGWPAARP
jgi:hypothetical protein